MEVLLGRHTVAHKCGGGKRERKEIGGEVVGISSALCG